LKVNIKYLSRAREIAGKRSEIVEVKADATLADLVERCIQEYGEPFRQDFFGRPGGPLVLLDGRQIADDDVPLSDGCSVVFMAAVSGGG
jgi:molybdopterin converting factor small subunit